MKKLIGGGDEGRCRQMLSGSWEVTNREEALNTTHELLTYAGDAGYRALRPALTDLMQLPTATVGWDTVRALRMLWIAHGAGYITEKTLSRWCVVRRRSPGRFTAPGVSTPTDSLWDAPSGPG